MPGWPSGPGSRAFQTARREQCNHASAGMQPEKCVVRQRHRRPAVLKGLSHPGCGAVAVCVPRGAHAARCAALAAEEWLRQWGRGLRSAQAPRRQGPASEGTKGLPTHVCSWEKHEDSLHPRDRRESPSDPRLCENIHRRKSGLGEPCWMVSGSALTAAAPGGPAPPWGKDWLLAALWGLHSKACEIHRSGNWLNYLLLLLN